MSNFQIYSDGAADIPMQAAKEHDILTIPFYVSLDGQTYQKELEELDSTEYFDQLVMKNVFPKTSLPSVQDYIDAFSIALEQGKDVLCFNITTTLSGSHQSALAAKEILQEKYPNAKILIMNSWFATGLQELLVMEAVKMRKENLSLDDVWNKCVQLKDTGRIMFMVGGLDHLQRGGRIGKVGAAAGGILKIKPLIELKHGEISLAGVTRSRKNGLKKLAEITKKYFDTCGENVEDYLFTIGATNTPDEPPLVKEELKSALPNIHFGKDFLIGATISAHTGPGTIGICFLKKYDRL